MGAEIVRQLAGGFADAQVPVFFEKRPALCGALGLF